MVNILIVVHLRIALLFWRKGKLRLPVVVLKTVNYFLKGNAYTVGKIIRLFTGKSPLKVLDFDEPLFENAPPKKG